MRYQRAFDEEVSEMARNPSGADRASRLRQALRANLQKRKRVPGGPAKDQDDGPPEAPQRRRDPLAPRPLPPMEDENAGTGGGD